MSWRPKKGWKGFVRTVGNAHNTRAEDYEAGADAYEAALFKYFYDNGIELWESGYMKGSDKLKALQHVPMSRFISEEQEGSR